MMMMIGVAFPMYRGAVYAAPFSKAFFKFCAKHNVAHITLDGYSPTSKLRDGAAHSQDFIADNIGRIRTRHHFRTRIQAEFDKSVFLWVKQQAFVTNVTVDNTTTCPHTCQSQNQKWEFTDHYLSALTGTSGEPHNTNQELATELLELLPDETQEVLLPCPRRADCSFPRGLLSEVIIHLNDTHRWTREETADWLDKISGTLGLDLTLQRDT